MEEYHVGAGRIEREGRLGGCFAWIAQHHMCDAELPTTILSSTSRCLTAPTLIQSRR